MAKKTLAYLALNTTVAWPGEEKVSMWAASALHQAERPPLRFAKRNQPQWIDFKAEDWAHLLSAGPTHIDLWKAPLTESCFFPEKVSKSKKTCNVCGRRALLVRRLRFPKFTRCLNCFYKDEPQEGIYFIGEGALEKPVGEPGEIGISRFLPRIGGLNFEGWMLHCDKPAIYLGIFSQEDFFLHASNGDGRRCFEDACRDNEWSHVFTFEDLPPFRASIFTLAHVFRCVCCDKLAIHWDSA